METQISTSLDIKEFFSFPVFLELLIDSISNRQIGNQTHWNNKTDSPSSLIQDIKYLDKPLIHL